MEHRGSSKVGTQYRLQDFTQSIFSFLRYFHVYCTAAVTGTDVDTVEKKFAWYKQNWLCYVMLCYVVLFYVMLSYVMLCYVMLCYVMLCYVMLCYVMLCYVMLCYVMLCCVMHRQAAYYIYL